MSKAPRPRSPGTANSKRLELGMPGDPEPTDPGFTPNRATDDELLPAVGQLTSSASTALMLRAVPREVRHFATAFAMRAEAYEVEIRELRRLVDELRSAHAADREILQRITVERDAARGSSWHRATFATLGSGITSIGFVVAKTYPTDFLGYFVALLGVLVTLASAVWVR